MDIVVMNQNFNDGMEELKKIVFDAIENKVIIQNPRGRKWYGLLGYWKLANSKKTGWDGQKEAKIYLLKQHSNIALLGNAVKYSKRGIPEDIEIKNISNVKGFEWFPYGDKDLFQFN